MRGDQMEHLIYPIVKNITVYSILVAVIMNILPKGQAQKQIKLFIGFLLLLIVISPITKLTKADFKMEKYIDKFQLDIQMKELTYGGASNAEKNQAQYLAQYEDNISKQMEQMIEAQGFPGAKVKIKASSDKDNFGDIESASIQIKNKASEQIEIDTIEVNIDNQHDSEEALEVKQLKKTLEDFYNIDSSNINIEIQG